MSAKKLCCSFFRVIVGRVIVKDTHVVQYCALKSCGRKHECIAREAEDLEVYRMLCENQGNAFENPVKFISLITQLR